MHYAIWKRTWKFPISAVSSSIIPECLDTNYTNFIAIVGLYLKSIIQTKFFFLLWLYSDTANTELWQIACNGIYVQYMNYNFLIISWLLCQLTERFKFKIYLIKSEKHVHECEKCVILNCVLCKSFVFFAICMLLTSVPCLIIGPIKGNNNCTY